MTDSLVASIVFGGLIMLITFVITFAILLSYFKSLDESLQTEERSSRYTLLTLLIAFLAGLLTTSWSDWGERPATQTTNWRIEQNANNKFVLYTRNWTYKKFFCTKDYKFTREVEKIQEYDSYEKASADSMNVVNLIAKDKAYKKALYNKSILK